MDDDAPQGLRARRRLDTQREIHEAALSLFEERGVHATTVQQIADRAGVSHRTFFRYFTRKEQAALPGHGRLLRAFDALAVEGDRAGDVLRSIERAAIAAMEEERADRLDEHRRITRLLAAEPELLAIAAGEELLLVDALRDRLAARLADWPPLRTRLVAEVAVVGWRAAWQTWGERALQGDAVEPADVYRELSAELRVLVG